MDSRRLRQFRRHRRLQRGDPTPPGREQHHAGTYPVRRTRGHARGSRATLPFFLRSGGNARPRSLDRTALPRPRWRDRSLGAPFLAYRTSDRDRNAADDSDLRDQGGAPVRAPPRPGNAEPAADPGLRSRILPRFRHLDDGGGARAGSRRPFRLRLSLCARAQHGRDVSGRRRDACVVPSLSARLRMGGIRSDERNCRQS